MTLPSIFKGLLAAALLIVWCVPSDAGDARVLVYQRNGKGFVHDNLVASAKALREIAADQHVHVVVSTNASVFADEKLQQFQAVIFANSNNEAFENDEQRAAFQRFLQSGGGFMGIHSSSGSERNWTWFQQMQGGKFLRHSPLQTFTVRTVDQFHPATAHFPPGWQWTDECYFFTNVNSRIRVLLSVDAASLRDSKLASAPGEKVRAVFPLAWCHESEGGRRFYTSLGHKIEHYSDPIFRNHLRGGIRWVLRLDENLTQTVQP